MAENKKSAEFADLKQEWQNLNISQKLTLFSGLEREVAEDFFLDLSASDQAELILSFPKGQRRSWIRMLPLDNTADLLQSIPADQRQTYIDLLDTDTKKDVLGLLAYSDDVAGGLMTPQFIKLKSDMEVEVAIRYIRAYSKKQEQSIHYVYVVDNDQRLLGVVSFRELLFAPSRLKINNVMKTNFVAVLDSMDQEEVANVLTNHRLTALPVLSSEGIIKGVVTYDDLNHVIQKETTEDIQKLGGMEALDLPYWKTGFSEMLKKRAGWLTILFISEMFTATAMASYEDSIEKAVVLALFIPLIISSGGNSGSQASTLIIRALALGEIKLQQWWKVLFREFSSGLALGLLLGLIGFLRIELWPNKEAIYGPHYGLVGLTVAISLIGVVLWGTTTGAMLPFILKKCKVDPASASAPFVATLVDVTGIVIYFSVAKAVLTGTIM